MRALLGGLAIALTVGSVDSNVAENCGIVGIAAEDGTEASEFLIEGLTILRNRGYDSAGVASVGGGRTLAVSKYASQQTTSDSIDRVGASLRHHKGNSVGIAHTRWATHGGKTDANAHPHTDSKKRIALVHNGTINNSFDLKKGLMEQGVEFQSETDTEVIAQLVGQNLDKGMNLRDSVSNALSRSARDHGA